MNATHTHAPNGDQDSIVGKNCVLKNEKRAAAIIQTHSRYTKNCVSIWLNKCAVENKIYFKCK